MFKTIVKDNETFAKYNKDVIKLFEDWCNDHSIVVYFVGIEGDLPAMICACHEADFADIAGVQRIYIKYLREHYGDSFVFVEYPSYAVEFMYYVPNDNVAVIKGGIYGEK